MNEQSDYVGKWIRDIDDEKTEIIDIVKVDFKENLVYGVGKNMLLSEFKNSGYRKVDTDSVAENPFARKNITRGITDINRSKVDQNPKIQKPNPPQSQLIKEGQNPKTQPIQHPMDSQVKSVEDISFVDEEEDFVNKAITLSKSKSTIKISTEINIPFDISKIVGMMDSFDIPKEKVTKVIEKHFRKPEIIESIMGGIIKGIVNDTDDFEIVHEPIDKEELDNHVTNSKGH